MELSNNPAVASGQIPGQAQIAIMKKAMDLAKDMNLQLVQSMQKSMQPHLGQNIDITV